MTELTSDRLRELLNYDPETGLFTWIASKGAAKAGSIAGRSIGSSGYLRTMIDGKQYLAHRLVWLYMTGEWPKEEIDHRNLIKTDNRWDNLREASRSQNARNQRREGINKVSGLPMGVRPDRKRYRAVMGKGKYLGMYDTPAEAHEAYLRAVRERFGDFLPEG